MKAALIIFLVVFALTCWVQSGPPAQNMGISVGANFGESHLGAEKPEEMIPETNVTDETRPSGYITQIEGNDKFSTATFPYMSNN